MNKVLLLICFILSISVYGQSENSSQPDSIYIYVEKIAANDTALNRYTRDNVVYTTDRTFIYDYYIVKNADTLKIEVPLDVPPEGDFQRM